MANPEVEFDTYLEVGDRVTFVVGGEAPATIDGDEVGTVIHVYPTPNDLPNLVDVKFPSIAGLIERRPETDFVLVQHHASGGPA